MVYAVAGPHPVRVVRLGCVPDRSATSGQVRSEVCRLDLMGLSQLSAIRPEVGL
nr:MAG TPA: hypothetical protein [Caudoviricetes sp.]